MDQYKTMILMGICLNMQTNGKATMGYLLMPNIFSFKDFSVILGLDSVKSIFFKYCQIIVKMFNSEIPYAVVSG